MLYSKKDLRKLIVPLMAEQFLAVAVGMADTIMVASVGESAVSGVALVDSITFLLLQLFAALCTGGAVIVSQFLGRKNEKEAGNAAIQLIQITIGISVILSISVLLFYKEILMAIFGDVDAEVMACAQTYFLIITLSFPFLGIYNAGTALLRSIGNTKKSLQISFIMNVLNIIGNALLIYGLKWGVAGAAVSSLFARIISGIMIMTVLYGANEPLSVKGILHTRPDWQMIKRILGIGIPSGLENGMFQIGKLLVQRLVASFGTFAIAANATAGTIVCLATIPGSAVSLALLSVTGRCMGARNPEEAVADTKRLLKTSFLSMAILNILVYFTLDFVVAIYQLGPQTTQLTKDLVTWHCLFATLLFTPAFCLPSSLRGAGDIKFTMKVSIISMWLFRIAGSYFLSKTLGMGILGVWFAIFADWLVRSILFTLRFKSGKWKTTDILK